jgi:inosine/xanthosine triphosphatase
LLVVLGSTNPVKAEATLQAFETFYEDVEVLPLSLPSRVKPFPTSEKETIRGAVNRALAAKAAQPDAEFAVGIESGIVSVEGRSYVRGYAVVVHGEEMGIGSSAAYEVSERLLKRIDPKTDESKRVIDSIFGERDVLDKEGVVGVLTRGKLVRTAVLRDAVILALTRFVSPEYYGS